MLDPFRAIAHNRPVAKAYQKFEKIVAGWHELDRNLRGLAEMAPAVKVGCSSS